MEEKKIVNADGSYTVTGTAQQSSIEVSRNAKGDISWSVKVYGDSPEEIAEKLAKFLVIATATGAK